MIAIHFRPPPLTPLRYNRKVLALTFNKADKFIQISFIITQCSGYRETTVEGEKGAKLTPTYGCISKNGLRNRKELVHVLNKTR